MKIREISPSDPVSRLALDGLMESAPILLDAEFYTRDGNADSLKKPASGTAKTKITRSLNENNTATGGTRTFESATKKIISFDAKVDVVLEDRNIDPEDELAAQTKEEAYEAGFELQDLFFNGDSGTDAEDFDGFDNKVKTANIHTFADNGYVLPVGNSDAHRQAQQLAAEYLLRSFVKVRGGATHAYMNELLKVRWLTILKELGYYQGPKFDEFGNQIDEVRGVKLVGAGYDADGNPLMPFTEACGTSPNTSGIFLVRWGVKRDLTCLTSVGVKGRYSGQSGNYLINNVNFDMDLVLQNNAALHKVKGWKLS